MAPVGILEMFLQHQWSIPVRTTHGRVCPPILLRMNQNEYIWNYMNLKETISE